MQGLGPAAFLVFIGGFMAAIAAYAFYRMAVHPALAVDKTSPFAPYSMVSGTQVAAEITPEIAAEQALMEGNPE